MNPELFSVPEPRASGAVTGSESPVATSFPACPQWCVLNIGPVPFLTSAFTLFGYWRLSLVFLET